jgi:hypothetical protein
MFRQSIALCVALSAASLVHANYETMFDEVNRDFGSVPRGQLMKHQFRFVNNTGQQLQIGNVRVSCGCTQARAVLTTVAPGQETYIDAQMDTRRFQGTKTVTIFVTFVAPRVEEVRLWVTANSRDEILFTPESLAFGKINTGKTPSTSMSIDFVGTTTRITEMKPESNYIQVNMQETKKPTGEFSYKLDASVRKDIPAGRWYTDVWLTTNNPQLPKLRIPVTVEVEATLTASPSKVSLGTVQAGMETERKVILRGVEPFKIAEVLGTDAELSVREPANESRAVHVLTVTLKPSKVGEFSRTLKIRTNLKDGDIEVVAQADVTAAPVPDPAAQAAAPTVDATREPPLKEE